MNKNAETLNILRLERIRLRRKRPTFPPLSGSAKVDNFERKSSESSDVQRSTLDVGSFPLRQFVLPLFTLFLALILSGCASPRMVRHADPEIERNAAAARTAYANGSLGSASSLYRKALERARMADQSPEISRLAYNLALCRAQSATNYDEVFVLLDEAQYEAKKSGNIFPEAVLLRVKILRHLGRTDEAITIVKSEINLAKKGEPALPELQIFLAETACDQNDEKICREELNKLDQGLLQSAAPAVRAREAELRGRVLMAQKQAAAAAVSFEKAAGLYQEAKCYADMGKTLCRTGDAYAADRKTKQAFDCYYRAARTLLYCGAGENAADTLKKADELAADESDRQMLKNIERLTSASCPAR